MKRLGYALFVTALLLISIALVVGTHSPSFGQSPTGETEIEETTATAKTVITVTSGLDLNTSKSETCATQEECTLRRAIVQSRDVALSERPVLIRFDIPETPEEGYDSALGIWRLAIKAGSDQWTFRRLKGQVIIDGTTQPGGRTNGPKIMLVSLNPQRDGLVVGDSFDDDNIEIRGLGFQNFGDHLIVNSKNNLIEQNWFGLNEAGTAPFVRNNNPEDGSGSAGVALSSTAEDNVIRQNVFAGFDGVAAAIRGKRNVFQNNLVGTQADGLVPAPPQPSLKCTSAAWLGGGGVSVEGGGFTADDANRIAGNVIAGLRQEIFGQSTQPDAIRIGGDYHVVQGNQIGLDGNDVAVGVCGRGIYLGGANVAEHTRVISNTIVDPGLSAISINGSLTDANLLSTNIIRQSGGWVQVDGKDDPETAIEMGPGVPEALSQFQPAKVIKVGGVQVTGASGDNSPCPSCRVELFLDDTDDVVEALEFLTAVIAGPDGTWSATLPASLTAAQGLRTTSTTAQLNTIAGMGPDTTTQLSRLYRSQFVVYMPNLQK